MGADEEELARTAGTIAANAVSQAELAARSEAAGDEGAAAIEAAVSGVEAVRDRIEVMTDHLLEAGVRSVVSPGARQRHVAQARDAESVTVAGMTAHAFATEVLVAKVTVALARPDLGHRDRAEAVIGLEDAGMAACTEQTHVAANL